MYYMVHLFRLSVYYGQMPAWGELLPAVVVALATLLIGWIVFTRRSSEFSYRI
jgi:ABC-type polysaccharide/polyol phosphate export permease